MGKSGGVFIEFIQQSQEAPLQCWSFSEVPERIAVGRSSSNDVVLSDRVVSRWHAEIVRIGSGWMFEVLGLNGAYLDGQRVDRFPLWDGACVQLGQTGPCLRFRGTVLAANRQAIAPQPHGQHRLKSKTDGEPHIPAEIVEWPIAEPVASRPQQVISLGPSRS